MDDSRVPFVSVIIPVLGDTKCLERAFASIGHHASVEIIVVNGGAHTPAIEELQRNAPWVRWIESPPGRGRQMNVGASGATGNWLLFLHADTRLPAEWLEELQKIAQGPSVGGSFRFQLDSGSRWARVIERGVAVRVRWFGLPYGDQALFALRDVFVALGGYRELPVMEDVDLVRRLRRAGRLHHSPLSAVTSARRWEADGWVRRSSENMLLVFLFFLGVSPEWLAQRYRTSPGSTARGGSDREPGTIDE
ncbi:MAG: TIGR04283 family arsenosugar biosynthesis glycosyltransferase [Acidobacteria bacterium]|nr:TIGR04283 family arsenosugar biosynthesis glycosyltransferase [Acidobacteriota bacterium]